MNKASLQRSGSKWRIMAAFTAAATIHLSALAIASLHHSAVLSPETKFTAIDVDPDVASPEPAQIEIPLPAPPPALEPPEIVESSNPPRLVQKRQAFVPIRSPGQTPLVGWRNSRDFALSAPRPEYPYEARSHHIMGSGVANLTVLPTSGVVVAA